MAKKKINVPNKYSSSDAIESVCCERSDHKDMFCNKNIYI